MKPHDDYLNGDGGASEDSSEEEASAAEAALSLRDDAAPARALAALNALRKSRQHYDTLLLAGGAELPAHRAVLAAASPYLLRALPPAAAPPAFRVPDVDAAALAALVEYAYTGRLRVREGEQARRLYRAAWRLRVEAVRAHLARALLRRLAPHDVLETRALPDLGDQHLAALDDYIAQNFDEVCKSGALASLPLIRIEMLRETSAEGGEESAFAVADAVLVWLRDQHAVQADLEDLCSRTHLLYVDGRGALRDCGELPAARGDAPELQEYRREAAERGRAPRGPAAGSPDEHDTLALGARTPRADCAVLAATRVPGARTTRALLALRGRLAAARVAWRDVPLGGEGVARGGVLGGAREGGEGTRARMALGRAAHGAAALAGRLLVCGGYDRARVLRAAEAYDPAANAWTALGDMGGARARFAAAALGGALYAVGGSDGQAELASLAALVGGRWEARARLPLALSHAGAAALEEQRALFAVGGWAAGHNLRRVLRYSPDDDAWTEAPPLITGRSQCAAVYFSGELWALGGCDAWHCLASTERLALGAAEPQWAPGPALPTARRSVGAAAWRGRLVAAGGSDGAASLRRTEWLAPGGEAWRAGPALRRPRAALGLAELHDVLYAVGGFDGKDFLSCVECLYEPDGEWTTLLAPPAPRAPPGPVSEDDGADSH